jgi:hypothetical protein
MNPIITMMKRYIKAPLKYALPLLFIGSLVLVATAGCIQNNPTPTPTYSPSSGGGTPSQTPTAVPTAVPSGGGSSNIAVTVNSQQTASQIGNYT